MSGMANKFFTSDLHLSHETIRVHCNRPFKTCEEMNEKIVSNINSMVSKKDELYIVGDFAWRDHGKWISRINGSKFLIKGNHDRMNQNLFPDTEDESSIEERHLRCFSGVEQIMEISVDKHRLIMCHFPMVSWNASCHGSFHCYGHVHGRYVHPGLAMDVGVDTNNYMPYSWEDIKKIMYAKIDENRIKAGLYIGWKQIDQGACIGIKSFDAANIIFVVHRGIDNMSAPCETETFLDPGLGDFFCAMGGKHYFSDFRWRGAL
jgi:calcineurin-like phosphoesterase family protein